MRVPRLVQRLLNGIWWFFLVIFLIVGAPTLLFGILNAVQTYTFLQRAVPIEGKIAGYKNNARSWSPIVEFEDEHGKIVRYTSNTGTNTPRKKMGEAITILYDPKDDSPTRGARLPGSDTWLPPFFTIIFGLALTGWSLAGMRSPKSKGSGGDRSKVKGGSRA